MPVQTFWWPELDHVNTALLYLRFSLVPNSREEFTGARKKGRERSNVATVRSPHIIACAEHALCNTRRKSVLPPIPVLPPSLVLSSLGLHLRTIKNI